MISASSSSSAASSDGTWKATCFFFGLGRGPRPAVALVFSRVGPSDGIGAAEELAEAPEAIEMPIVLWHVARCTSVEDFAGATKDFGGGAVVGTGREGFEESGREGFEDSGREGIAEELSREGTIGEALVLRACFLGMDFLGLTEASAEAAAATAESSLNFLTASVACLANLPWRLAHSSG